MSHFVGRELGEGRQVHLDGIGYFVPTLTCTEPVTLETKRKSTKVKLKNITFRPDKALRSEIGVLKVKPLKLRNLMKKRLTDDEVKQKVVNYLRKNEFITRSVVQSICGRPARLRRGRFVVFVGECVGEQRVAETADLFFEGKRVG